jgi:hypothetical protein
MNPYHPSIASILQYFDFEHLPEDLQKVSRPFARLAFDLAAQFSGPEVTVALRKLLESKDAAVRASLKPLDLGELTRLAQKARQAD